jgi:hypothetical protein
MLQEQNQLYQEKQKQTQKEDNKTDIRLGFSLMSMGLSQYTRSK